MGRPSAAFPFLSRSTQRPSRTPHSPTTGVSLTPALALRRLVDRRCRCSPRQVPRPWSVYSPATSIHQASFCCSACNGELMIIVDNRNLLLGFVHILQWAVKDFYNLHCTSYY